MSLKKQAFSGVKWTTTASIVNSVVQLIQLAILTRLLEPTDFGLMALVMVVIGFSEMFVDMGVSNAIIYKQKVDNEQLSSLYWLNIIIGIFFFIILVLTSPFISILYDNQSLTPLINLVAATFLIKPWGQQFMVLLQKNLQFNAIAITDIISRLISFFVVIVLAFNSFGVYSLAIGSIIVAVFSTIGYNYYGRNLYKPKLYLRIRQLKQFLSFGLYQMGEKLISYFSTQFDTILIGKLLGVEILGLYNVAKNLVSKPSNIINPVVTKVTFPLMSKFSDNISQLKSVFLTTMKYLSLANFLVYFLIIVLARPIIITLFGIDWVEVTPIVQILSLTYLLRSIGNPSGSLLLSRGKANIAFYWNLALFVFYPISIFAGSYWGITGIAWGTFVLQVLLLYPNWRYIVNKTCNADFTEYFGVLSYPLIISTLSFIFSYLTLKYIDNYILALLIGCVGFIAVFILLIRILLPDTYKEIKNIILNTIKFGEKQRNI
jgi:O-antigen/teichoic acid export membrane protein